MSPLNGGFAMSPLEQLFRLEIEFHRRLRAPVPRADDAASVHTCFTLQYNYEPLLRSLGTLALADVEQLGEQLALSADARDLLAARDSLKQLIGHRPLDP
jgi:hypothetical protein